MSKLLLALALILSFSSTVILSEEEKCSGYIEYYDEDTSELKRVYLECRDSGDLDFANDDGDMDADDGQSTIFWTFDDSEK